MEIPAVTSDDLPAAHDVVMAGFATYATFAPPGWEPPADMGARASGSGWPGRARTAAPLSRLLPRGRVLVAIAATAAREQRTRRRAAHEPGAGSRSRPRG